MKTDDITDWIHDHVFDASNPLAERSTRAVMWITLAMMVVEIVAGWWYNSMALQADGWHMSSHAVAIGLSAFAYSAARRYARDPRFAFGTWKMEVLGGFASAIFLLGVAGVMVVSSVERLITPEAIHYEEAIVVAVVGLLVNVLCAWILGRVHQDHAGHGHGHGHSHGHAHSHSHSPSPKKSRAEVHGADHGDLNLKSAYVHVITDAATSVLAIAALVGGWIWGWSWLDPAMGVAGAVLVAVWAKGLIEETGKVLLDREMDHPVVDEVREVIEADGGLTRITDLHVWRVGKAVYSCALAVRTRDTQLTVEQLRERLAVHEEIVHSTIEIHHIAP